jgi:hypothetical protein
VKAAAPGILYIDPPSQSAQPQGATVTVQVKVANMPSFSSWQIGVKVNQTAVNPVNIDVSGNVLMANYSLSVKEFIKCVNGSGTGCGNNDNPGVVTSGVTAVGTPPTNAVISGLLFTITYTAGSINLSSILLFNYDLSLAGNIIPHADYSATNAIYGNGKLPVADFTWQPLFPFQGDSVIFNASASSDPNPNAVITSYLWDFQDPAGSPPPSSNPIQPHVFRKCIGGCVNPNGNQSSIFAVTLTVTDNLTISNSKTVVIAVNHHPLHDFAIADIRATPEIDISSGSKVSIDVVVLNNGTFTEAGFTVYANVSSFNAKLPVKDLGSQSHPGSIISSESADLFFTWDTSGNPPGTYQIEAWVPPIRNATFPNAIIENITDNNFRVHLVSIGQPFLGAFIPLSIPETLGLAGFIIATIVFLRSWIRNAARRRGLLSEKLE